MSWLDINTEELEENIEANDSYEPGSFGLEPGCHTVKVVAAYLTKSDKSDAEAFNLEVENVDGIKDTFQTWFKNREGGTTYTDKKTGKEKPLPGVIEVGTIFKHLGVDINAVKPVSTTMELYGNTTPVKVFKELTGKKLTVCVQQEENEWEGQITIRTRAFKWLNEKGENTKGENKLEDTQKYLEKNPLKKLKKSAATPQISESEKAAVSDW
jgi:hypothetical protein